MENNGFASISIMDILKAILRKWWLIALVSIICAAAGFGYANYISPQYYTASIKMYVNNITQDVSSIINGITTGDINAKRELVDTYEVILKAQDQVLIFLKEAGLDKKYTPVQASNMISIESVNDTEVFSVTIKSENKEDAVAFANAIANKMDSVIPDIIDGTSVKIVEGDDDIIEGGAITATVSKGLTKFTAIGFIVGFVISAALVFVFDLAVNDTIDSVDKLKKILGDDIPLLAVIPDTSDSAKHGYGYKYGYRYGYRYKYHSYGYSSSTSTDDKKSNGEENK